MKKLFLLILLIVLSFAMSVSAQPKPCDLALIEETLRDFKLPIYQGGEFQLTKQQGKNVLLVFPRGYYDKDLWCSICAYEYLDLVDVYQNMNLSEKYNLEVVIVLPYDEKTIEKWLLDLPEVYESLEKGKHISDTTTNQKAKDWAAFANKHYSKTFSYKKGEVPRPFKILVDKNQEVSERLGIFKTEWWGTKVDQNIPTIILLNKDGTVVFKYISQHTIDRPTTDYIMKILATFLK